MAGITGLTIAASYDQLIISNNASGGNTSNLITLLDGDGATTYCVSMNDASTAKSILSIDGSHANGTALYIDNSAGDGDVSVEWQLSGTTTWLMGIEDGDSDTLKICHDSTMGTDERLSFLTASTVVNQDQGDIDFRVESASGTHLLFCDASTHRIGINETAPESALDVVGVLTFSAGTTNASGEVRFNIDSGRNAYIDGAAAGIYISDVSGGTFPFNSVGNLIIEGRCDSADGSNRSISLVTGATPSPTFVVNEDKRVAINGIVSETPDYAFEVNSYDNTAASKTICSRNHYLNATTAGGDIQLIQDPHPAIAGVSAAEALNAGDRLGCISFLGSDDTSHNYSTGAGICAYAENDWSSGNAPTYLTFTTHDGAAAAERLRIGSDGTLTIDIDYIIATATTTRGLYIDFDRTGNVASSTDTNYGIDVDVDVTGQGASGSPTVNTTGVNIHVTGDNAGSGTSKVVGIGVDMAGAGDSMHAALFNGGSVGIGNTSPSSTFHVRNTETTATANVAHFECTESTVEAADVLVRIAWSADADVDAAKAISFHDSAGEIGSISMDGNATAFNTSSDYRLKTDLKDIVDATGTINKLKLYDFAWKKNTSKRLTGVIAHEAAEIVPYAIIGEKDGMLTEEYKDEDGNKQEKEVISPQGADYSKFVPLLLKSIQELSAKVDALENNN